MEAVAVTAVGVFVKPLTLVGTELSRGLTALFAGLHWSLWLPASLILLSCFVAGEQSLLFLRLVIREEFQRQACKLTGVRQCW